MPVISLLTDFGTEDEYVGLVKAVIYGIAPDAVVVDLCHRIPPQDVAGAAFMIASSWRYFPAGSVHLVVVDPGVGTDRAIIAARSRGHVFVAPDNGVLSGVFDADPAAKIVKVENRSLFLAEVSRTFHGRDIFAPVGAHLLRGVSVERLGPAVSAAGLHRLPVSTPEPPLENEAVGFVVWVDRFGNLVTDIGEEVLNRLAAAGSRSFLQVRIRGHWITGISESYADVAPGAAAAVVGSRKTLEIAVNCASASDRFGCGAGETVLVRKVASDR